MSKGVGPAALLAACLAGVGGTGAQCVLLAQAGFVVGQSSAAAFGPGAFVAGWAATAWWAGRSARRPQQWFGALALGLAPLATLAAWILMRLSSAGGGFAPPLAFALLVLAGAGQGAFLPLLARVAGARSTATKVGGLFACNLLGCVCGAYLLGFVAIGAWGRIAALGAAIAASVLAAGIGWWCSRGSDVVCSDATEPVDLRVAALMVGVTFWTLAQEWLCTRVAVLWIGSESAQLSLVLACALFALAAGAALLPRLIPATLGGVMALTVAAAVTSAWPLFAPPALDVLADRGAFWVCATLVMPPMVPLGAFIPLLHAWHSGESGRRLGDLLRFEIVGALSVGPLLHELVLPACGVSGSIAVVIGSMALSCLAFGVTRGARASSIAAATLCATVAVCAWFQAAPALRSPKWRDPSLTVLAARDDQHFAVAVVDDGLNGERTLLTDQFRAAGTGRDYRYMRALGHLPVLLHVAPRKVAVLALGTGTTLGAVALHRSIESIDVLEISSAVVEFAPWFESVNGAALQRDSRVHVIVDDGRRSLARTPAAYDVLTMEPLLPDSPFGVYLYTPEFYAVARRSLAPGGVFCQWVPPHALEPQVFDALVEAFAGAFPCAQAWLFGTQLLLVGADQVPALAPERFEELGDAPRSALAELGLADFAGARAHFVAALAHGSATQRRLSDLDPWIAWRRKPSDGRVLTWLPTNLESLARWSTSPPWNGDPTADATLHAARAVLEARIALGWSEIEVRTGRLDAAAARERALAALTGLTSEQLRLPCVSQLRQELDFTASVRLGIAHLNAGELRAALDELLRAAELRSERADVHAYVAAVLERAGKHEAAAAALKRALSICPRLYETPVGDRLRGLGLAPASEHVQDAAPVER